MSPYVYNLYWNIIVPEYLVQNQAKKKHNYQGLKRSDIRNRYFQETQQLLEENKLRLQILPMLQTAGLLEEDTDQNDKRVLRYIPTKLSQNNSEQTGRVTGKSNT